MKPHKHAELIKQWADGAEIQARSVTDIFTGDWKVLNRIDWDLPYAEYRIKPEPKPDVEVGVNISFNRAIAYESYFAYIDDTKDKNLKLTFDGETGELKSAEVLK